MAGKVIYLRPFGVSEIYDPDNQTSSLCSRNFKYENIYRMLRLSNIILDEVCGYMHVKKPSRCCTHSKAKFMMEMSDKVSDLTMCLTNNSES